MNSLLEADSSLWIGIKRCAEKHKLPDSICCHKVVNTIWLHLLNKHSNHARVNHLDNFLLVACSSTVSLIMDYVVEMSNTELAEQDWWHNGFIRKYSSGQEMKVCHLGIYELSREICKYFYRTMPYVNTR